MKDLEEGKPNLDCDTLACDLCWMENLDGMILLYNSSEWVKLAESVMKIGYGKDLAYYFLGQAAEGMGYNEAALKYYNQGVAAFSDSRKLHHCRESGGGCGGLDLAQAFPQRIAAVKASMKTSGRESAGRKDNKNRGGNKPAQNENKETGNKRPVTSNVLDNLEIGGYLLKNGKYEETVQLDEQDPDEPGIIFRAGISNKAFGDLNGDGITDGVVIIWCNTGGNGSVIGLAAAVADSGKPIVTKVITLGDSRIDIRSMKIEQGMIILRLITHGPNDGLCCPSVKSICKFKLEGSRLVNLTPKVLRYELKDYDGWFFR
ncbi:hypothetical protein SAMN04489760_13831 [Syntrophus gentianae]|uniref:Uncharacterized protein n=1 Tax=Syntrophus gentianae TaxID=43775 RepID=A0A1H8AND7_9BACT|nr:hypothetical protein [Syntrophus gentianae]SEM72036.1 hypothetical protein SAMN04489760_13831 [Syntrophus gentianae]